MSGASHCCGDGSEWEEWQNDGAYSLRHQLDHSSQQCSDICHLVGTTKTLASLCPDEGRLGGPALTKGVDGIDRGTLGPPLSQREL